jgi:hypothetical protein
MNLISFVDELVKVGAVRCLIKRSADISMGIPDGVMNGASPPPSKTVMPDDASTRLAPTNMQSGIKPGSIGDVGLSKAPIDRDRFNRPIVERR